MAEAVVKRENFFKKVAKFFKETKSELKKVVWPTLPQTINNTFVVITAIIIVGAILFVVDTFLSIGIQGIITQDFVGSFTGMFK